MMSTEGRIISATKEIFTAPNTKMDCAWDAVISSTSTPTMAAHPNSSDVSTPTVFAVAAAIPSH